MKLTKTRLKEMIREEIKSLREISGTLGGSKQIKGVKAQASNVKSKKATRDTKQTAKTSKLNTWNDAKADYVTKAAAVDTNKQFRKSAGKGKYNYSKSRGKGYSTNPDYTLKVSARDSAETARDSTKADYDTASSDFDTSISNLSAAEKAQVQAYIDANLGFGGGGGGQLGKNSKKNKK